MKRFLMPLLLVLFALVMLPATALAHPGHYHPEQDEDEFATESFVEAATHPFTGLDHLVTALAIGWLAVSLGRQRGGLLSIIFLSTLLTGWMLGRSGHLLPLIEPGLAVSVLLAGILLALREPASPWLMTCLVAFMGFWNGNAHGNEIPALSAGAGLFAGTCAIVLIGWVVASLFARWTRVSFRLAGACTIVTGLVLCVARIS